MTTIDLRRVRPAPDLRPVPAWHARAHIDALTTPAPWRTGEGRHRRDRSPSWRAVVASVLTGLVLHPVASFVGRRARLILASCVLALGEGALYVLAERWVANLVTLAAVVAAFIAADAWVAWHLPQDKVRARYARLRALPAPRHRAAGGAA